MFEKPNMWMTAFIIGLFIGLVTGLIVYLIGYPEYAPAGLLAFLITATGILGFTYLNELYTHLAWHRSQRATARKDRAKAVAMAQYWADWQGGTPSMEPEPELDEAGLVIQHRSIPVDGGKSTIQARSIISAQEWDRRQKAVEFFRWAYTLNSVTSTAMVPRALNSAADWTAITSILVIAGLLVKENGKTTTLTMSPMEAIDQIGAGRVALEGRLPPVNICPIDQFLARTRSPSRKVDGQSDGKP